MYSKKCFLVFAMCVCCGGSSNTNYPYYRNLPTSIISQGNTQDFHNITIYLGFANNPFDGSTPTLSNNKKETPTNQIVKEPLDFLEPPTFNHIGPASNKIDLQYGTADREQRSKRGVIHLYSMVSCATGCSPLIYKGYGCYCGFLGSGYAVDGIDKCCKIHDWCYDRANCPMFLEYFVPYYWKCYRNVPLCAVPRDQLGGPGSCSHRLCECDRLLSQCLSKYPCPSKRALCKSSPWRLIQNAVMGF